MAPTVDGSSGTTKPTLAFSPGFEAGLRLGIGLPVGRAGDSAVGQRRKIGDLATWRTPIWVDVAYRVSPGASYGMYGQFGVGGTGDSCTGRCDWSDLRVGAQGQWRLNPEADMDPWLGLGVGLESLSFQSLDLRQPEGIDSPFPVRTTERLLGPELLLQGGLALRVEDSLVLGPYVSASIGSYLGDRYKCDTDLVPCPGGASVNGSAFHAWLGVGLSGSYAP